MKTIKLIIAGFTAMIIFTSCSKESIIEGIDTPYDYKNLNGQSGWLHIWIVEGSNAEKNCNKYKIYEGVHYLGTVEAGKHSMPASFKGNCNDSKPLRITMPVGTFEIKVISECGTNGGIFTKKINRYFCTYSDLQ